MEDPFDFLKNYKDTTDVPTPKTLEDEGVQGNDNFVEIMQNEKKAYMCTDPGCGKIFRFKSAANRHFITHQNDRPYSCTYNGCSKSFKRPDTLEDHLRTHNGNLPFSCNKPGCNRSFASKPALRYHQIRHKNTRVYKCDIEGCDKSFLTLSQLKQHKKASCLHFRKPNLDLEEDEVEVHKIHKSETSSNPSTPDVKSFENIQQEVNTKAFEDATLEENMQHKYKMYLSILAENQVLKEKLRKYEEEPQVVSENAGQDNFQSDNQNPESVESSSILDNYELRLLEFLRKKE